MRAADRDSEFVQFVSDERDRLVRMARLLTAGDDGRAEDVVQTTLTKLYLSWAKVRRADNRLGYARAALTHAFIDESRRAHRRRETLVDHTAAGTAENRPSSQEDVELRDLMHAALAALAPGQRAVVVLRHWLDLDVAETSRILGCSTGTVKSQNAKALSRLRELLDPTLGPERSFVAAIALTQETR
jgi:RNA polymerase sigma-70 factor (sigma-E family)